MEVDWLRGVGKRIDQVKIRRRNYREKNGAAGTDGKILDPGPIGKFIGEVGWGKGFGERQEQ